MSIAGFSPAMPSSTQDSQVHERKADSDKRLAQSQGVGGSQESGAASEDRDADGRQAWRWTVPRKKEQEIQEEHGPPDLSGQAGSFLDLNG